MFQHVLGRGHLEGARLLDEQVLDDAVVDDHGIALAARAEAEFGAVHGNAHRLGELAVAVAQHEHLVAGLLVLAQAPITNASLTEMQAMVSTPFALSLSASATNPGTCFAKQLAMITCRAKATTFLPGAKSSSVVTALGSLGPQARATWRWAPCRRLSPFFAP